MSTNINISVGDNKLLEQARLQQSANRQAQLEKEANQRLTREAEIERVNALAAQGKDANGNLITGTPTGLPQIERRPAANRLDDLAFSVFGFKTPSTDVITIWPKNGEPTTFNLDPLPPWTPPTSPISGGQWFDTQLFTRNPPGPEGMSTLLPEAWIPPIPAGVNRPTFSCYIGSSGNKADPGGANYDWVISDPYFTERWQRTWDLYSFDYSVSRAIILPVKKDVSVLVYKSLRVFYKAYYYAETFKFTGIDKEPLGGGSFVLGQYLEATFTDSYSPGGYEYDTTACFLISKSSVKQIAVPQGISTLLADWNPFPTTFTESVQARTPFNSVNIGEEGIQQCTDISDPINNTSFGITNVTRSQTVTKYTTSPQVDIANARTKKSYGIGLLTTTFHTSQMFSPIVYTLIKDPNSKSITFNSANNSSYSTAKDYSEVTPPTTFINVKRTLDFSSQYTASFVFEKTTTAPVNDVTPMSAGDFTPLKASYTVNYSYPPGTAYTFYVAWDWNKSGYCTQQALALGFSASDLQP